MVDRLLGGREAQTSKRGVSGRAGARCEDPAEREAGVLFIHSMMAVVGGTGKMMGVGVCVCVCVRLDVASRVGVGWVNHFGGTRGHGDRRSPPGGGKVRQVRENWLT